MADTLAIEGHVAAGFEPVRELFAMNFARRDDYREAGAALCVYEGGRKVVDLWGGVADPERDAPWRADTLVNVWSTTKALAAFAVAACVDRGLFAYDDPVASVWPDFAQAGKGAITIAQAMSHQAGLPGFAAPTTLADMEDWEAVTARLAAQAPAFMPGAANSYHATTYGFIAGEIVRRATGRRLGRFVAEEICTPLGADFFIGLPQQFDSRVARLLPPKSAPDMSALNIPDAAKMALINPAMDPARPNTRAWRAAEMPALNGQASARGVARVFAALAGDGDGVISERGIQRMIEVQTRREDLMLGFRPNWAMGVAKNEIGVFGPNPESFGHTGWGGSFGCADRERGLAIGYVCNQMGADLVGDPRGARLCGAIYERLDR